MGNQPSIVQLEPDRERIETGGRTYFPQTEEKETESRELFSSCGVQSKLKSAIVTENTTHRKNSPKMNINVRRVQSSHEEEKHQVEDLTLTEEIGGKRNNIGGAGGIPLSKGRSQHLGITAEKVRYREEIEKNEVHGNTPTAKICKNKHMSHKKETNSNGERIQEDEEEEEKKPTITEGVLEVIVSNPLGNQPNNENQSFIVQDNLKQNEEKFSFDLNSSYGVVLQGKLEGTCQNASHNRIYDISREYERATGRKIECETLVDPRAEQIVVTSAGKSFWIIPSTHSFSRHSGVCALLGDKNIKPIPHQLQVGDILRLGSVGLLVTEINNGKYTKNDTPSNESKENDRKSNIDDNKIKKETSNFPISIAKQSSQDDQEIEYIIDSTTEHVQPEITGRIRDHISAQWPTRLARNRRSMEGSESMLQCYICMDGEESEEDPLIAPCDCKGGTAFLHLSCLKKLIEVDEESRFRLRSSSKRKVKCSRECPQCRVCKGYYATHKRHLTDGRIEAVQCEDTKPPYITMTVITKHDKVPELFNTFYRISFNGGISEVSIGRAAICDVVIAYRTVSTKHAVIKYDSKTGAFYFVDAKSSNGSLLYLRRAVELHRNKKIHLRLGRCMLSLLVGDPPKNKTSSAISKIANTASASMNAFGSVISKAMTNMIPKGNNLANKLQINFCNPNDEEMEKAIGKEFLSLLASQQDPVKVNKINQYHPLTRCNINVLGQIALQRAESKVSKYDPKLDQVQDFKIFAQSRLGEGLSETFNQDSSEIRNSNSKRHYISSNSNFHQNSQHLGSLHKQNSPSDAYDDFSDGSRQQNNRLYQPSTTNLNGYSNSFSLSNESGFNISRSTQQLFFQRGLSNLTYKQSDENEATRLAEISNWDSEINESILSSLKHEESGFPRNEKNLSLSSSNLSDTWNHEPATFQPHRSSSFREKYPDQNSNHQRVMDSVNAAKQINMMGNSSNSEYSRSSASFPSVNLPTMNNNHDIHHCNSPRNMLLQDTESLVTANESSRFQGTWSNNLQVRQTFENECLSASSMSSSNFNRNMEQGDISIGRQSHRPLGDGETPFDAHDEDMMFTAPLDCYNEDEEEEVDIDFMVNADSHSGFTNIHRDIIDPQLLEDYGYSLKQGFPHEVVDTNILLRPGLCRGVYAQHVKDESENQATGTKNFHMISEMSEEEMDDSFTKTNIRPLKFSRTQEYQRNR